VLKTINTYNTKSIPFCNSIGSLFYTLILTLSCFTSCQKFSSSSKDHPVYFDKIIDKSTKLREAGNVDKCIQYLDSAYAKSPKPGIGDLFKKYNLIRYCYFYDKKDYKSAMVYADSMLKVLEGHKNQKEYTWSYASANFTIGDIYFEQHKYNEAYQAMYKGKLIAEKVLDPCALSEYSSRLAMVCYKQSNFRNAIKYFKKAINEINYCKKDFVYVFEQQRLMDNIGLSFNKLNMADSASVYYGNAFKLILREETNYKDKADQFEQAKAVVYGNLAEVLMKMKNNDSAEVLLTKSISINIKRGFDNQDARFSQLKLADLYLETNRLDYAEKLLSEVRMSLDSLPQDETELRWRRLKWKYFDKAQRTGEAYMILQAYISLRDSLKQSHIGLMGISIDSELDNFEKEHQLDILKKADELKKAYLIIGFSFFVIITLILFFTWRNWKRTQKNLAEMAKLNRHIFYQNHQFEITIEALEQSIKDKDRIMKVVAHDLNNPIAAIASISEMLLMEKGISIEHKDLLKLIKTSSINSIEMINDLVEALLNTSETELKREMVDLNVLIQESVDLLYFKAEEKDQKIVLDKQNKVIMNINREKIMRVVINLIVNAIKFSPFAATIKVGIEKNQGKVIISVADNGIGIPSEIEEIIFNMFTKAQRIGTNGEPSFGLGLSISKKIVESHKGNIGFKRNVGGGTIFYFELPI